MSRYLKLSTYKHIDGVVSVMSWKSSEGYWSNIIEKYQCERGLSFGTVGD